MKRFLLEFSWLDRFLPTNLKPAPDEIFGDKASIDLIRETESIFDKLIEQGNPYKSDRTIKKVEHEYAVIIKILKKQIRLQMQDGYHSKAHYNKRIEIICLRPTKNNGQCVCSEATVHYVKNNRTYVSSVKETAVFRTIFRKIAELEDVLSGKKPKQERKQAPPNPSPIEGNKHEQEMMLILNHAKQIFKTFNDNILEPLIESRLRQIIIETEKLIPNFSFLDIEERYNVKRMFREDIPKLLQTYRSLSPQNRQSQTENVYVSLSKMELAIIRYQQQVEKEKVLKMEQLLKLNELRYSSEDKRHKEN